MASTTPWATVVGTGLASALIAYPLMYLALANRYKASLSGFANACLFVVAAPVIGIADLAFDGGDSTSYGGLLVLLGVPFAVCFIVIGAAFESKAERAKAPPGAGVAATAKEKLRHFGRPAERAAFVAMLVGLCLLVVGLLMFWVRRGFFFDQLKYDLVEVFFDSSNYHRYGWAQWLARIGIVLSTVGFIVAFLYERTIAPLSRALSGFARWVRTGE
jgi:hypothetical protein